MLNFKLITPPTVEPVILAQAKQQCRVDIEDDDAYITGLIVAARQYAEKYTKRAFFNQTWRLSLDNFPLWLGHNGTLPSRLRDESFYLYNGYYDQLVIRLPRPSCVSVTSVTYVDLQGNLQTLDPSTYRLDNTSEPARLTPIPGTYWPLTELYLPGSVQITYVAGSYGDGVEINNCPQTVVMAMLLLIGHWYQNREETSPENLKNIPLGVCSLLDTEKFESFSFGNN